MSDAVPALIYCPFPDRESARAVASQLLGNGMIGCANLFGDMESLFEWNGKQDSGLEVAVLFKTNSALLDQAIERLGSLHPYETPAITGWCCDSAHPATVEWLGALQGE